MILQCIHSEQTKVCPLNTTKEKDEFTARLSACGLETQGHESNEFQLLTDQGIAGWEMLQILGFFQLTVALVVFPCLVSLRFEPEIYLQSFLAHGCVVSLPALTADGHIVW